MTLSNLQSPNLPINKKKLFIKIWLLHIFNEYTTCAIALGFLGFIFNRPSSSDLDLLTTLIFSLLAGIIRLPSKFLLFIAFPTIVMKILINKYCTKKWFKAYTISILVSHIFNYLWIYAFSMITQIEILYPFFEKNLIFYVIPSLAITITTNWFVFKKTYKQIQQENNTIEESQK